MQARSPSTNSDQPHPAQETDKDLFKLKGKVQLTQVFVETTDEARASEEAGIDMTGEGGNAPWEVGQPHRSEEPPNQPGGVCRTKIA